jgi:hypothetical protein
MTTPVERLRGAMMARALAPSPEVLAKECGISAQDAELLFSAPLPSILALWAVVCVKLRIRMLWVLTGRSVPQVSGTLGPQDLEALQILGRLDDKARRAWLRTGRHMVES